MNSLNLKIIKDYIDKKSENAPPGKSAYDVAVDNGFVGSEAQWLNTLQGQKGDTGAAGAKGDKGDKGDTGNDYVLTAQDKADIADIVLQELPTTQGVLYGNTSN